LENSRIKYDAIFVDEGQDYSDDMFKVIKALLNEDTDNLTIALDDNQNIYKRKRSWKNLGINAVGKRTQKIDVVYRYTVELTEFFNQFVQKSENLIPDVEDAQIEMFPGFYDSHGPAPLITQFSNIDEIIDFVTNKIIELRANNGIPFSEISLIYASNYYREPALPVLPAPEPDHPSIAPRSQPFRLDILQ
jgi:superfamily I DNA/RNA helicase